MALATARLLCLLSVVPTLLVAQEPNPAAFNTMLQAYVSERGVDYSGLKADRANLDRYVAQLAAVTAAEFDRWQREQQLAYLLNSYNAIVLQSVINNYPIKRSLHPAGLLRPANSVWQIPGFFSDAKYPVAGRRLTLDEIEHKLLRATLKEPRIHFALVCAARSCPPLRPSAYTSDSVDVQLNDQARKFLNDDSRNLFDRAHGTVKLSEIFKWFAEDFGANQKGVIAFVTRYMDTATQQWLRSGKYRVTHFDYDWNLNDAATR